MELSEFEQYLTEEQVADNTIATYLGAVRLYLRWYEETFGADAPFRQLYHENVQDYVSFLVNLQRVKPQTVNAKLAALVKFNGYLVAAGRQEELVITKRDYKKMQASGVSPSTAEQKEVDAFRQRVLTQSGPRDHAIITVMAYAGTRVSETISLELADISFEARVLKIRVGKGDKYRATYINDKIIHAVRGYLKERRSDSPYLFVSREGGRLHRSRINQICKKHSGAITPHTLRHFYCTNALEKGYEIHEVANQAGHRSIQTTLKYTNPTQRKMKEKANRL